MMFGVEGMFSIADIGEEDVRCGRADGSEMTRGRCVSVSLAILSLEKSFRL